MFFILYMVVNAKAGRDIRSITPNIIWTIPDNSVPIIFETDIITVVMPITIKLTAHKRLIIFDFISLTSIYPDLQHNTL